MLCVDCGRQVDDLYANKYCYNCYRYYCTGGEKHPLPPKGVIQFDVKGLPICHICGRSYVSIGKHAQQFHGMPAHVYREEFGLCRNAKLTAISYSHKMRDYAIKNRMDEQLQIVGMDTRVKPGEKLRKGKKARLQECLIKKTRARITK